MLCPDGDKNISVVKCVWQMFHLVRPTVDVTQDGVSVAIASRFYTFVLFKKSFRFRFIATCTVCVYDRHDYSLVLVFPLNAR